MKKLSKFLYICTFLCINISEYDFSRAINKQNANYNFSNRINNYSCENNQTINSLNTQKVRRLNSNERIIIRIKAPKNEKENTFQKQDLTSYRKTNCSKIINYKLLNIINYMRKEITENKKVNQIQTEKIRVCRITADIMIDHHYHQINRRETGQDQSVTKVIKEQITIEDMTIEKITVTISTKMIITEGHLNIIKISEDHHLEVTVNTMTDGTKRYHHHQDHQVEGLVDAEVISENKQVSLHITNYHICKLQYTLVWESRQNWTSAPGSRYEIPESAKNRSKRNNGINGPDIVSKIEWAGNFQLSDLEDCKTWGLGEDEGNNFLKRVNKVKVNPLQRHVIIRLCDKIGIVPDDVEDMNERKNHWQLKNDDEIVSVSFKQIFTTMKFSVFYNNKLSADGVWKTISLLKFIYDSFIPQNFSKGNNLYVCLPDKVNFVKKFKKAFAEPKFQKCLGIDDINLEIRKLECLRMKKDAMFNDLDLHAQFQHRAEDVKGTAIQLASRFLASNEEYDTDAHQKNFLQTQIEYNKRPFPDMNSFWMILNNSEDEKGNIKERAWNEELKRPDARSIPELIKLMGHNDGLKKRQHTMDEDENQIFHIRCRNNMMVRYVYPLKMAGTVETFNPVTNKNEYKSSVNLFDLSVTTTTNSAESNVNNSDIRQINNDMQSNLTAITKVKTDQNQMGERLDKLEEENALLKKDNTELKNTFTCFVKAHNQQASNQFIQEKIVKGLEMGQRIIASALQNDVIKEKLRETDAFATTFGVHNKPDMLRACNEKINVDDNAKTLLEAVVNDGKIVEGVNLDDLREMARELPESQKDMTDEQKKQGKNRYNKIKINKIKLGLRIDEVELKPEKQIKLYRSDNRLAMLRHNKRTLPNESEDEEEEYRKFKEARLTKTGKPYQIFMNFGGKYYSLREKKERKEKDRLNKKRTNESQIGNSNKKAKKLLCDSKDDNIFIPGVKNVIWKAWDEDAEAEENNGRKTETVSGIDLNKMDLPKSDSNEKIAGGTEEIDEDSKVQTNVNNVETEGDPESVRTGEGAHTEGEHIDVTLNYSGELNDSLWSEMSDEEMEEMMKEIVDQGHMTMNQLENMRKGTCFNMNFGTEMTSWPNADDIEKQQKEFRKTKSPRINTNSQKFTFRFIVTLYSSFAYRIFEAYVANKKEEMKKPAFKQSELFQERITEAEHALAGLRVIYESTMDPRNLKKLLDMPNDQLQDEIWKKQPIPKISVPMFKMLVMNFERQLQIRVPTFQTSGSVNTALYIKFVKILLFGNVSKNSGAKKQMKMDMYVKASSSKKPPRTSQIPTPQKRPKRSQSEDGVNTPKPKRKQKEKGYNTPNSKNNDRQLPFTPIQPIREEENQQVPNISGKDIFIFTLNAILQSENSITNIKRILQLVIILYLKIKSKVIKHKKVYPIKRTKCSIAQGLTSKRAKNKCYNLHNMIKSVTYCPTIENKANFTQNTCSKCNIQTVNNEKEFIFHSPGGKNKNKNGKSIMIKNFQSRYEKTTDILSDNESTERTRANDEDEIEIHFQNYQIEKEYEKPERIGSDGIKRRYLIDKMEKKNEFDNVRYNELKKRKANIFDPCSASTMPSAFQTKDKMEYIVEDQMHIHKGEFLAPNKEIEEIANNIIEKREKRKIKKKINAMKANNGYRNTKFAQKLKIVSVNLNKPIHQLGKLIDSYKDAHIICINELRTENDTLKSKKLIRPNWTIYSHKPLFMKNKNMLFSAILIRNDLGIKTKLKYNQAPFTSVYCEIPLEKGKTFGINICTFYKFHPKRDIANALRLFSVDSHYNYFIQHFQNIVRQQAKVPSIITGDINAQIFQHRKNDNKFFNYKFRNITNQYKDLVTMPTNRPNKRCKGEEPKRSQIDIFMIKDINTEEIKFKQEPGDVMCSNDGHDVMSIEFNAKIEYDRKLEEIQIIRYPDKEIIYDKTKEELEKIKPELDQEYERLRKIANEDPCKEECKCNYSENMSDNKNRKNNYTPRIINLLEKIVRDSTKIETIVVDKNKPVKVNSKLTKALRNDINDVHNRMASKSVRLSSALHEYYMELKLTYRRLMRSEKRQFETKKTAFEKHNVNDEYKFNREFNSERCLMRGKTGEHTAQELADYFQKLQKSTETDMSSVANKQTWEEAIEKMDPREWTLLERGHSKLNSLRHILSEVKEYTTSADSVLCGKTLGAMPADLLQPLLINMMKLDVLLGEYPIRDKHNSMVRINKASHPNPKAIQANRMLQVPTILASMRGKWISANIAKYADTHGIVPKEQHGFKKRHSCSTAMADILLKHHDTPEGYSTYMLVIDFKNAFGTVRHDLIKQRFSKFAKCNFLKYLCGELDNRTAVVRENNEFSEVIEHIPVGLPQGSALGPIGFNCMSGTITGVIKNVEGAKITLFADDCLVTMTKKTIEEAKEATQKIMGSISEWSDSNGLLLEPSKCTFTVIGKEGNDTIEVNIKGKKYKIKQENHNKYLGFRFDQNLSFHKQINHLKFKLSEIRISIINVMNVISRKQACKVARALIYGNLNYGAEIMPIQADKVYKKIDRMIIRIIEDIYGWKPKANNKTNNQKAFAEVKWINFKNLHELSIMRFTNRILMNGTPETIFEKINKMFYWKENDRCFKNMKFCSGEAEAERLIRIGENKIPHMKADTVGKDVNLFPYNAIKIFNELPRDIKERIGTRDFSTMVTDHYKTKCQHRIGKSPKHCQNCRELEMLDAPIDIEYTGYGLQFDVVSFAGYRADARTNKDIGNVINNARKSIEQDIKKETAWKQLVEVEEIDILRKKDHDLLNEIKIKRLHQI